jgi:hypothetical protein
MAKHKAVTMTRRPVPKMGRCGVPGLVKGVGGGPKPRILRPHQSLVDHESPCAARRGEDCNCTPTVWQQGPLKWQK